MTGVAEMPDPTLPNSMARRVGAGAILFAATVAPPALPVEFSGYVNLTTDYVFRGVSYSDSDPAVQLGADVAFSNGLYLGAYGSTVDIQNGNVAQRDAEIIYYLGYWHEMNDTWSVSATAIAYTYPGASGSVDYDYEELAFALNYDDRAWLEYAYSPDLYNSGYDTHNVELYTEWPLPWQLTAGAGVGWYDVSALAKYDYWYWQAGLTRPLGPVDVDLRYHDTSRWVPIISTPERAEARLVLSLRLQF